MSFDQPETIIAAERQHRGCERRGAAREDGDYRPFADLVGLRALKDDFDSCLEQRDVGQRSRQGTILVEGRPFESGLDPGREGEVQQAPNSGMCIRILRAVSFENTSGRAEVRLAERTLQWRGLTDVLKKRDLGNLLIAFSARKDGSDQAAIRSSAAEKPAGSRLRESSNA